MLLKNETDTINSLCDPSDHCGRCESEETYLAESKTFPFQWRQLKLDENRCKQWRLKLMKREAEKINSTREKCHSNVPERFREPLMKVAYKLLSRDEARPSRSLHLLNKSCGILLKQTRSSDF